MTLCATFDRVIYAAALHDGRNHSCENPWQEPEEVSRRTNFSMFSEQKEDQWSGNFAEPILPKYKEKEHQERYEGKSCRESPVINTF